MIGGTKPISSNGIVPTIYSVSEVIFVPTMIPHNVKHTEDAAIPNTAVSRCRFDSGSISLRTGIIRTRPTIIEINPIDRILPAIYSSADMGDTATPFSTR